MPSLRSHTQSPPPPFQLRLPPRLRVLQGSPGFVLLHAPGLYEAKLTLIPALEVPPSAPAPAATKAAAAAPSGDVQPATALPGPAKATPGPAPPPSGTTGINVEMADVAGTSCPVDLPGGGDAAAATAGCTSISGSGGSSSQAPPAAPPRPRWLWHMLGFRFLAKSAWGCGPLLQDVQVNKLLEELNLRMRLTADAAVYHQWRRLQQAVAGTGGGGAGATPGAAAQTLEVGGGAGGINPLARPQLPCPRTLSPAQRLWRVRGCGSGRGRQQQHGVG